VRLTSSAGRAFGCLAAGTIVLSTAFVGTAGVALAEPLVPPAADTGTAAPALSPVLSVPNTPSNVGVFVVDDGAAYVGFNPPMHDPAVNAAVTGYEVSTDNGTTWGALTPESTSSVYQVHAWIRGLQNKQTYQVAVRATSAAGPSLPTASVPTTPAKPIGAPGNVTAVSWDGEITVRWTAPTVQGSYPLEGYTVDLWNPGMPHGGEMEGPLCTTTALELTCTGEAPAGSGWLAMVSAVDTEWNWGTSSAQVAVVPASSDPTPAPEAPTTATVARATNLVATTGPSSITATWGAPATAGDHDVAFYGVTWSLENRGDIACEVAASAPRTCTFDAEAGQRYTVSVVAVDTEGNGGEPVSVVVTAGKPVARQLPATVPASDGKIGRAAGATGSVAPGEKVVLRGEGYAPNSAVTVAIYSEPQELTTVFTDANGAFEVTVAVPAGLAAGTHTLVATGVDRDGNVRNLTLPVTVAANGAASLASTGADIALPLSGGIGALLVGGSLLVAARRRQAV
jgi:hypothetical protein